MSLTARASGQSNDCQECKDSGYTDTVLAKTVLPVS